MAAWITNIFDTLGYVGVAFLMFLENIFPPIPSELIMPLAGFGAARGDITLFGAIIAGAVGSVIGQFPLYWLGYRLGQQRIERLADRYGRWLTISSRDIARASSWFRRRGGLAVLICRLVPGVRSLISIPAGINRLSLVAFTLYSAVGMLVWSAILAVAGYTLGENYDRVASFLGPVTWIVVIALVAALLGWIGLRIWNCHRDPNRDCLERPEQDDGAALTES